MKDALHEVLAAPARATPMASVDAWWSSHRATGARFATTVDRAIAGGFAADRLGWAFASGYREALAALVPEIESIASLCATEEGGNAPRAIRTTLTASGEGFVLDGKKRFATMATRADVLFVVATTGTDDAGRNRLRIARVPRSRAGVSVRPMPETPFAPEIPHAEIALEGVAVGSDELLPGDGYDRYLKPFRTVEDAHVLAASLGYLVGLARRRGATDLVAELVLTLVAARALALESPSSPEVHVALAGAFAALAQSIARLPGGDDEEQRRFERDQALFLVAGTARKKRTEAAWRTLGAT